MNRPISTAHASEHMNPRAHVQRDHDKRCAACGEIEEVAPDPRCGDVPFCSSCRDWARGLTEWDDLGVGD